MFAGSLLLLSVGSARVVLLTSLAAVCQPKLNSAKLLPRSCTQLRETCSTFRGQANCQNSKCECKKYGQALHRLTEDTPSRLELLLPALLLFEGKIRLKNTRLTVTASSMLWCLDAQLSQVCPFQLQFLPCQLTGALPPHTFTICFHARCAPFLLQQP